MRIREVFGSIVSVIAIVGATLIASPTVATAAAAPAVTACPSVAPTAALIPAVVLEGCSNHETMFDAYPLDTEGGTAYASAMNEAGTRVAFARTAPRTGCHNSWDEAVEFYIGEVDAVKTRWIKAPALSFECGYVAGNTTSLKVVLNKLGTAGVLAYNFQSDTYDQALNPIDPTMMAVAHPFTVNTSGAVTWGAAHTVDRCDLAVACNAHQGLSLRLAADTGDVLVADWRAAYPSVRTQGQTVLSLYKASTGQWTDASIAGTTLIDAGISRNGKTTYVVTSVPLSNSRTPALTKVFYCLTAFTSACINHSVSWRGNHFASLGTSAISGDGKQLALAWSSTSDGVDHSSFATTMPLTVAPSDGEVSPNLWPIPSAFDTDARYRPPQIFLSPDGKRMWLVSDNVDRKTVRVASAAVSGWTQAWGAAFTANYSTAGSISFSAAMSTTGRLSVLMSDSLSTNVFLLTAENNAKASEWFTTPVVSSRPYHLRGSDLHMNASGTRWVASGRFLTDSQVVAMVGTVRAIPVRTKAQVITGAARLHGGLTVVPGAWNVTGGRESYVWLRDGQPIAGATSKTYRLTTADLGHRIQVATTFSKSGYFNRVVTTASTAMITGGRITATELNIAGYTGHPTPANTLSVDLSLWAPIGLTLTYTWKAGTRVVGRDATYTPQVTDADKKITVTVTGSAPGYTSVTKTSAATTTVIASVG